MISDSDLHELNLKNKVLENTAKSCRRQIQRGGGLAL